MVQVVSKCNDPKLKIKDPLIWGWNSLKKNRHHIQATVKTRSLVSVFCWFLEPSSTQSEIEHFVFMHRKCGTDCLSMLNPVHHCLLLEFHLKPTFSSTLTHPFEVCRIVIASHYSGHYLLCTEHLSIFTTETAHYRCQFYFLLWLLKMFYTL